MTCCAVCAAAGITPAIGGSHDCRAGPHDRSGLLNTKGNPPALPGSAGGLDIALQPAGKQRAPSATGALGHGCGESVSGENVSMESRKVEVVERIEGKLVDAGEVGGNAGRAGALVARLLPIPFIELSFAARTGTSTSRGEPGTSSARRARRFLPVKLKGRSATSRAGECQS